MRAPTMTPTATSIITESTSSVVRSSFHRLATRAITSPAHKNPARYAMPYQRTWKGPSVNAMGLSEW